MIRLSEGSHHLGACTAAEDTRRCGSGRLRLQLAAAGCNSQGKRGAVVSASDRTGASGRQGVAGHPSTAFRGTYNLSWSARN